MSAQQQLHAESLANPREFWSRAAQNISWFLPPTEILHEDPTTSKHTWFKGGLLNTCYNCVDRHVFGTRGGGDKVAIAWESPVSGKKEKITYRALLERIKLFSGVLREYGVEKGDTVLIYMPMIPEAIVAMLSCARIGAIHSVVFGGFAPKELSKRIEDCKPKVIISASCGIEPKGVIPYKPMLDDAIKIAKYSPNACIIYQRPGQITAKLDHSMGDRDWAEEVTKIKKEGKSVKHCVDVESDHPSYILYTSGTTGIPKGVVRETAGHAVALWWTMKYFYGCRKGDVFFSASDIGWVVGHSYIVYGPLLYGITTIVYEGKPVGTPDAGAFWRIIKDYDVNVMFTAPTAMRAIRREDPNGEWIKKIGLKKGFRALYLAGERTDPSTLSWCQSVLGSGIKIVDNYWSTEIGSPITGICQGIRGPLPSKPGAAGVPLVGHDVRVILDNGKEASNPCQFGNIVLKLPLAPSAFPTLWKNPKGYKSSYFTRFPGYLDTGDAGFIDNEGYVNIMSRTDDIINIAGHRLSTGSIEQILNSHPAIAESCVVPLPDSLKGHKPLGILVLKISDANESTSLNNILSELSQLVRRDLGAIASFDRAVIVKRLPKTRSGKVLRRCVRDMVEGNEVKVPATIEDVDVIGELQKVLEKEGLIPTKKAKL